MSDARCSTFVFDAAGVASRQPLTALRIDGPPRGLARALSLDNYSKGLAPSPGTDG